jgi:hypothetical protein
VHRQFTASQDKTYLRTIAMGQNHLPPGFDHVDNMSCSPAGSLVLIGNRLVILVNNQRVAANGNHREFPIVHVTTSTTHELIRPSRAAEVNILIVRSLQRKLA